MVRGVEDDLIVLPESLEEAKRGAATTFVDVQESQDPVERARAVDGAEQSILERIDGADEVAAGM
jgi:hypothetical protein